MTVLFADVAGFTGRSEQLDPEDVRRFLDPFFSTVRHECERRGGTLEKFIGDAAMALFGTPTAHEDDPERAVRAGLAILDAVRALNRADPALDLHVRLAVNTGEVLVAVGPSRGESPWIATGDTVNTCARMQAAAPLDTLVVGELAERLTREAIAYRPLAPVTGKGKAQPIPIWEAQQALAAVVRERPRDAPLIGRDRELGLLVEALERTRRQQQAQLVTLVGAPGIGKSRLLFELIELIEEADEPIVHLAGRSLPYGDGHSSAALAQIVKSWARVDEADSADAAGAKLAVAVADLIDEPRDARWVESHLRPLVGAPTDADTGRRDEAFAAWRHFVEALAERSPLVLLFEDLHWADDSLLDFVDHLLDWTTDLPLLVVATARPELLDRRRDWGGGKLNAHTVSLAPLSADDTERLFSALLERVALPGDVRQTLLARAAGNPLYAGEYARMLVDRGLVRRDGVGWKLDPSIELPLPESVQGIIAARLDALRREEKALLQDAAVLGQTFWVGALAAVGSVPREAVEERLRVLERKEFSRRDRRSALASELQYEFRHVLVRDVAYAQIPRARRVEKHRRAAEWLESLGGRSHDQAELLAYHYLTALELARESGEATDELELRARQAAQEAGDHASAVAAYASAMRFYETALQLVPVHDPARADLLFRYGRASFQARQQGAEALEEARELLLARGDLDLAAEADVLIAGVLTSAGRRDEARMHLERAAQLVESGGSPRSRAHVLTQLARFLMLAGETDDALSSARDAVELAREQSLAELQAHALVNAGIARVTSGDVEGIADLEAAIMLANEVNSPEVVRATRMLASMHLLLGRLDRAAELYASAREQAERFGDAFEKRWLAAARAMELHWSGRWQEALDVADAFVARTASGVPHYMEAPCRRVRGEIRLARGDLDGALADAEDAVEFAQHARDPWFLYPSLTFRARALQAQGRDDEAAAAVDELLALDGRQERLLLVSYRTAADLAAIVERLGRNDELLARIKRLETPTRWLLAAAAYASGDLDGAAEAYERIGSLPDAAEARLAAAERLLAAGRREEAEERLAAAAAFFEQVGAGARLDEARRLLADAARG